MIRSVGVDLASISRVRGLVESQPRRFVERLFTELERAYCSAKADPVPHLAARMAAKEATMKALGAGTGDGVGWRDIEVQGGGNEPPRLVLRGGAEERARSLGIERLHLSLSHESDAALAFVVAESLG